MKGLENNFGGKILTGQFPEDISSVDHMWKISLIYVYPSVARACLTSYPLGRNCPEETVE